MEEAKETDLAVDTFQAISEDQAVTAPTNASGHRQELDRNFSLMSICGFAISSGGT